jgi:hypothetical protein
MRAASRFLSSMGCSFGLAVAASFMGGIVSAESVRLGTLVTEIYPEIAARNTFLERRDPASLDRNEPGGKAESENGDKRLRTLDYAEILGRQFVTELDRRKYDLSDIEVQALVRYIVPRANSIDGMPLFVHHMNRRDRDLMIDYGGDVIREAADESIQEIGWLDDLENRLKSVFKYELFVEGTGEREYTNREFEWEDRKEALRQEETTVVQAPSSGRGRYDAHYGMTLVNIDASYESIVGAPSAYVRWEKMPVVDKVKLEVQPLQEVSLSLRDSLNERWYWQGKAMLNGDLDPEVAFNLTRRDEARRNRLTFFAEFGEYERIGVMFGVLL